MIRLRSIGGLKTVYGPENDMSSSLQDESHHMTILLIWGDLNSPEQES